MEKTETGIEANGVLIFLVDYGLLMCISDKLIRKNKLSEDRKGPPPRKSGRDFSTLYQQR
jgi:hypothetical protein